MMFDYGFVYYDFIIINVLKYILQIYTYMFVYVRLILDFLDFEEIKMTFYSDYKPGWTQIGSKSYNLYKQSVNFTYAFDACRDIGARLATLQDRDSQMEVASKSLKFLFVVILIFSKSLWLKKKSVFLFKLIIDRYSLLPLQVNRQHVLSQISSGITW